MTNTQIAKILKDHGIQSHIIDGKIIAVDSYTINGELFTELTDLTGIGKVKLLAWLGY